MAVSKTSKQTDRNSSKISLLNSVDSSYVVMNFVKRLSAAENW